MNIVIIGTAERPVTKKNRAYYQKYMTFFEKSAALASVEADIKTCMFEDLVASVGDGAFTVYDAYNKLDLSDYDVIFVRGKRQRDKLSIIGAVNEYASIHNIAVINERSNVRDLSKFFQAVRFHQLGAPVPRTLLVTQAVLSDATLSWTFPCIMKAEYSSHGEDNYLVQSLDEVKVIQAKSDKRFVLQRFVPNDGDYRILMIGEQTVVIRRHAEAGSHLNNTSQGGTADLIEANNLPRNIISQAKDIMQQFGMSIAGVDVMADKTTQEFFFLEVNGQPQLMSGAYVEEKERAMSKLLESLSHER